MGRGGNLKKGWQGRRGEKVPVYVFELTDTHSVNTHFI